MAVKKKILSVLAHPDDESFGMGGTLALYASQEVEIYLICATKGEVGEVDDEHLEGYRSKAELRVAELSCAAKKLGIKEVIFLEYRDSGMIGSPDNDHPNALVAQNIEEVSKKIIRSIRQIKPQVVLTFDPVGGYHHPDHIAIHDATVLAFQNSGGEKYPELGEPFKANRLYFHLFPRAFIRVLVKILKLFFVDVTHFGKNKDIDLEMLAGDKDYPKHVKINYNKFVNIKEAASNCHASQINFGNKNASLISWFRRMLDGKDIYMQAYPVVEEKLLKFDLFE